MKISVKSWVAAALLLAAAPGARAQDMPVMDWLTPHLEAERAGELYRHLLDVKDTRVSISYNPTPALRQATIKEFVARHQRDDPATSLAFDQLNRAGTLDYPLAYKRLTDHYNLYENDAGDALAAYLMLGYAIVNNLGSTASLTADQQHALRHQLFPVLAKNATITAPGGAAHLGEALKLEYFALNVAWDLARKKNTLPAFRQATAARFKTGYKSDFTQLALTKQGLVKR